MIIFGVKVTERVTETGTFLCSKCRTPQHYRRLSLRRWFSLYFIPVIPLGRIGEQVECQGCFSRYAADVLWANQPGTPQSGDRTAGIPNAMDTTPGGAQPPPNVHARSTGEQLDAFSPSGDPHPNATPQPVHHPFTAEVGPTPPIHTQPAGAAGGPSPVDPAFAYSAQPRPVYNPFVTEQGGAVAGSPYGPSPALVTTSSLAICSLILALVSPFLLLFCGLSLLTSIAAVITGHTALRQIRVSKGAIEGRGVALSGVIAGYVFLTCSVVLIGLLFLPALVDGWNSRNAPAGRARRIASRPVPTRTSTPARSTSSISPGRTLPSIPTAPTFDPSKLEPRSFGPSANNPPSFDPPNFDPPFSEAFGDGANSSSLTPADLGSTGRSSGNVSDMKRDRSEGRDGGATPKPGVSPFVPIDALEEVVSGSPFMGTGNDRRESNRSVPTNPFQRIGDPDDSITEAQKRAEESRQRMEDMLAKSRADLEQLRQRTPGLTPPPFPRAPFPNGPLSGRNFGQRPNTVEPPAQIQPVTQQLPSNVVQRFSEMGPNVQAVAFSPDGNRLAVGKIDRTLSTLDLKSGKVISVSKDVDTLGSVDTVSFASDGQAIVAGGARGAITVVPVLSGGQLGKPQPRTPHQKAVESLLVSPSGKFVISGSRGEVMWQPLSGDQSRKIDALDRKVIAIFLPQKGLTARATDGAKLVEIDLRAGSVTKTLSLGSQFAHAAAFSPDGTRLALSRGKKIAVMDTDRGHVTTEIETDHTINWILEFSPDGRRIASGGRGEVEVWDAETGNPVIEFDLGGVLYVQSLAISPDGKMLAAIPSSSGQTLQVFRLPPND